METLYLVDRWYKTVDGPQRFQIVQSSGGCHVCDGCKDQQQSCFWVQARCNCCGCKLIYEDEDPQVWHWGSHIDQWCYIYINDENKDTSWQNTLRKEIGNIGITFEIKPDGTCLPGGMGKDKRVHSLCVKIYFERKSRWVKDDHRNPDVTISSYAAMVLQKASKLYLHMQLCVALKACQQIFVMFTFKLQVLRSTTFCVDQSLALRIKSRSP